MIRIGFVALCFSLFSIASHADKGIYSREALAKAVNEMSKQLPMQVDSVTTITSVFILKNNNIQYRYALDKEKVIELAARQKKISVDELKANAVAQFGSVEKLLKVWSESVLRRQFIITNCSTPETRKWIENGISLVHTIYDKKGVFFYETIISTSQCLGDE
jgi:hypothetical protein